VDFGRRQLILDYTLRAIVEDLFSSNIQPVPRVLVDMWILGGRQLVFDCTLRDIVKGLFSSIVRQNFRLVS
jgi:hypothetical protein